MAVAEVDHGSDIATAAASASATRINRARSRKCAVRLCGMALPYHLPPFKRQQPQFVKLLAFQRYQRAAPPPRS